MRPRLPNLLTGARLVAVVPFALLLATAPDGQSTAAAIIFIAASLTDYLDGYLARHAHAITRFGRIVDPLADRLLINLCVILLAYHGRLSWWLAAPLLLRDAYLLLVFERRQVATEVRVTMTGKVATALIMVSLAGMMLTPGRVMVVLYALGLGTSLVAGVQYLTRAQGGLTSKPS
jgi:CDP-diacylglycerol--glycerol-3-phosphate 3-phosphatidyltransferase